MKISSQGKKILVFSDVHQDIKTVKEIIKKENADVNICLGDWYDSFHEDLDKDVEGVTEYLNEKFFKKEKNISLFGNHDVHYVFDNEYTICSGYTVKKAEAIDYFLGSSKKEFSEKFLWFIFVDDYLCTHAGLHKSFIPPMTASNDDLYDYLNIQSNDANIKIRTNQPHWFYRAGMARGGSQSKGGITWLDFDLEFSPVPSLSQIVGHTYRKRNKVQSYAKTDNYCIDTNLNEYFIITNGKLEVKSSK